MDLIRDSLNPPAIVAGASDVAVYLDPPGRQQFNNRLFDRESNPYAGDDILAPYAAIYRHLTSKGFAVQTADLLPDAPNGKRNVVISFGIPDRMAVNSVRKYAALARRPDVVLSAFFAMECPIVEPTLFASLPTLQKQFKRIMSWSDADALLQFTHSRVEVEHFCWPQSYDAVHEEIWSQRDRKFLLMMNANKLPRLYVDELYTARLRAVEYFQRFGDIDLYGRNWDRMPVRVGKTRTPATIRRIGEWMSEVRQQIYPDPLYVAAAKAWRGSAKSKSKTVAQYRFALCFENSVLKGWMTEKLFDCFFAGTVPIYWGAPDVLDWVPAECFIDMRNFKDFGELRSYLLALAPADEQRYRDAARNYLASDQFTPFRIGTFVDLVSSIISADTGVEA